MAEWESPDYFSPGPISNEALRTPDLPDQNASWQVLQRFALTFDAYEHWGSFEKCEAVALNPDFSDLVSLRTTLFYEQRRWRHYDAHPDEAGMATIRAVVAGIHAIVGRTKSA